MIIFYLIENNRTPTTSSSGPDVIHLHPFCHLDVKSSTTGYGFYDDTTNNTQHVTAANPAEITSIAFDPTGLHLVAGTQGGNVALYDVRSSKPLHVKEHQYGLPIHTVRFHNESGTVLSGDAKLVKCWRSKPSALSSSFQQPQDDDDDDNLDPSTPINVDDNTTGIGSILANIEGTANFSHFIAAGDETDSTGHSSGLILCAGDQPKMQAFYVPALGRAPRWCSFLDSITEELEERDHDESGRAGGGTEGGEGDLIAATKGGGGIYQDYKFLTRSEIDSLGISNLVGTPLLRGYMHGFFVDVGFYNRIRAVANPFEYEEYRKSKVKERMDGLRASRIAPKKQNQSQQKKRGDVNKELAVRLEGKANAGSGGSKGSKAARKLMEDDRFGSLFKDKNYAIDEDDLNFKLRNPSGIGEKATGERGAGGGDTRNDDMDSDADDNDDDDDDGMDGDFVRVGGDEEDDDGGRGNDDSDNNNDAAHYSDDYDDNDDDDDDDEDGIRGGKIRGENYEEMKALEKKMKKSKTKKTEKKDKSKKKSKGKKITMYEADGHDGSGERALKIGLGGSGRGGDSASNQREEKVRRRRQEEIGMSLEEKLKLKQASGGRQFNSGSGGGLKDNVRSIIVKGEGVVKEMSFIPKDTRKKNEARKRQEEERGGGEEEEGGGRGKRKRRGVKDLGFKTPFKNKM